MPDLSDLVPFHSGQVENFNLLVLGQVQNLYKVSKFVFHILTNYEFTCCFENSVDPDELASAEARSQLIWIYTVYKRVDICMASNCFRKC